MERVFPNLLTKEGSRDKIDSSNATVDDLVSALVEVSKAVSRFEATADSRFGLLAKRRIIDLVATCDDLKRRIDDIRSTINGGDI